MSAKETITKEVTGTRFTGGPDYDHISKVVAQDIAACFSGSGVAITAASPVYHAHIEREAAIAHFASLDINHTPGAEHTGSPSTQKSVVAKISSLLRS